MDVISEEFNKTMEEKYNNFQKSEGNLLYPQILEYNEELTRLLDLDKTKLLVETLLGKDSLYLGSDGNCFKSPTPWHRDYLIKSKTCKMLIYLEEAAIDQTALSVIPGSQFTEDAYSSFLTNALTWPEPPALGGFDEKGFLGKGHSPLNSGGNNVIPQHIIPTSPGDIIVFNHNLIHCTNASTWNRSRRLMGLHFGRKDKVEELKEISLTEMNSFKLENKYGPYVMNSKSKNIQSMIKPLKDLKIKVEGDFSGKYATQSKSAVEFSNKHKNTIYKSKINEN